MFAILFILVFTIALPLVIFLPHTAELSLRGAISYLVLTLFTVAAAITMFVLTAAGVGR